MLSNVDLASSSLGDGATRVAPGQSGGGSAPSHNAANAPHPKHPGCCAHNQAEGNGPLRQLVLQR
eukprot:332083-Lingulodinium_polyedra.AAC.1